MKNDADKPVDVERRWPDWPHALDRALAPEANAHKDMLDGLAVIFQRPEITDLRNAAFAHPEAKLGVALNKKQTACKMWLAEELERAVGPQLGRIHILAGWYGVLALILRLKSGDNIQHVTVFDRDPTCKAVAETLNATAVQGGQFTFRTADIISLYAGGDVDVPDVIINTSCEHLPQFGEWFETLPRGATVALQSNDYYEIPEHVNCIADLDAFRQMAPFSEELYAGALKLPKYTRFMLIGRV